MTNKPGSVGIVYRSLMLFIGIALLLSACIFPDAGGIPEDLCIVQTDNRFSPQLSGRPNTFDQIEWMPGSDIILLKNDVGRLHFVNALEGSTERPQDAGIQGLWFALAPDASSVAVLEQLTDRRVETRVIDLESRELVTTVPGLGRGSFSPDGKLLAGAMSDRDESWVGIVDLDDPTRSPTDLLPTEGRRVYYLEGWSHRRDWISITESTDTGIKISVVEWPSGTTIPLHDFLGCHENSSWSPATNEIAYQGNPNDNWDIFVELPGADKARNLTATSETNEYQPTWSPDGRQIAYVGVDSIPGTRTFWQELFVIDVLTGEKVQITDTSDEYESLPQWSPDGTKIAYLSEREGELYLYTIEPNGANRTELVRVPK